MAEPEDRDADADQIMEDSGFLTVHRLGLIARPAAAEMIAARLQARDRPRSSRSSSGSALYGHPGMTVQALRALAANGGLHETDAGIVADREVLAKLAQEPAAELVSPLLDRAPEAAQRPARRARPGRRGERGRAERGAPGSGSRASARCVSWA